MVVKSRRGLFERALGKNCLSVHKGSKMINHFRTSVAVAMTLAVMIGLLVTGCTREHPPANSISPSTPHVDGSKYSLSAEPAGAKDVIAARKNVSDGDDVVVVGRIGGDRKGSWVEGRAAFSIVDRSLTPCSELEGDQCKTPWDYCCEADLPTSMAFVKFVDQQGKLVKADARQLLQVKELQTVVIRGKAERDDAGNLTVLADGIFVRK